MLLEVRVNDDLHCRAAVDAGVVSAFVNLLQIEAPDAAETPPASVSLAVSGFVQGPSREPEDQTPVHWGEVTSVLVAGDTVTIRVIDAEDGDPPTATPMLPIEER